MHPPFVYAILTPLARWSSLRLGGWRSDDVLTYFVSADMMARPSPIHVAKLDNEASQDQPERSEITPEGSCTWSRYSQRVTRSQRDQGPSNQCGRGKCQCVLCRDRNHHHVPTYLSRNIQSPFINQKADDRALVNTKA